MSVIEALVQKETEKNPDLKKKDIEDIRNWLKEQPHLPHAYINDLDIILAHHCCEYDIEMTKRVIDLNFTLRSLFTFYSCRQPDKSLETACHTWLVTPLKMPTLKEYRAVYCHLIDPDTKKFVYSDVVRAFVMIMDLWQYEEGTWPGVAIVVNMDNVTLGHISGIDLNIAQQFFYFLQEAMFIRLKEFHFINAPNFADKLVMMLKPFLRADMLDMLKVHPAGSDSLDRYIPRAALPKEAGGLNKDCITLRGTLNLRSNKGLLLKITATTNRRVRFGKPSVVSHRYRGQTCGSLLRSKKYHFKMPQTAEERREKKKNAEKKRRERIKANPELHNAN